VISATNKKLLSLVNEGKFREDLYYRLNVIDIELPPLRNRKGDILLLAKHFIRIYAKKFNKHELSLSRETEVCLMTYKFPGNVRELENAIHRAIALTDEGAILPEHLPASMNQAYTGTGKTSQFSSLAEAKRFASEQAEREFVTNCLKATEGRVRKAARMAGIDASNFHKIMKKHGIDPSSLKA
jgi:DNA-binding NtrC family response regulator